MLLFVAVGISRHSYATLLCQSILNLVTLQVALLEVRGPADFLRAVANLHSCFVAAISASATQRVLYFFDAMDTPKRSLSHLFLAVHRHFLLEDTLEVISFNHLQKSMHLGPEQNLLILSPAALTRLVAAGLSDF